MKKTIKIFLLILLISLVSINNANAESFSGTIEKGEVIPNIYYYKHRSDTENITYPTHFFHESAYVYRESINNNYVYCIESWNHITGNQPNDFEIFYKNQPSTQLSDELLNELNLISYYGYGYKSGSIDHTGIEWYAFTQMLIWRIQAPQYEHYFVDSETSTTPLNIYDRYMDEIMDLVNKHKIKPSISNNVEMYTYKQSILTDRTNTLNNYKVINSNSDITVSINNNKLTIDSFSKPGTYKVKLLKEDTISKKAMKLYLSNNFQNLMEPGKLENDEIEITINVKPIILKYMLSTMLFEDVYYDDSLHLKYNKYTFDKLEMRLTAAEDITDGHGTILYEKGGLYKEFTLSGDYDEIVMIPGKYLMEQITLVPGYEKLNKIIQIKNNVIVDTYIMKSSVKLNLHKDNEVEDEYSKISSLPGKNVIFGLYADEDLKNINGSVFAKKDTLLNIYTTNEDGNILDENQYLVEGKYYFKELSTIDNYETNEEKYKFYFEYENSDKKLYEMKQVKVLNVLKRGKVSIYKRDSKTSYALEGVEYELYNDNNNLIYELTTDVEGKFSVLLTYGKYYLKETKSLDGYYIDNKIYLIELNDDEYNMNLFNEKISNSSNYTPDEENNEENVNSGETEENENNNENKEDSEELNEDNKLEEEIPNNNEENKVPSSPSENIETEEDINETEEISEKDENSQNELIVNVPSTSLNNYILLFIICFFLMVTKCIKIKLFSY